jgi:hypothetical protein
MPEVQHVSQRAHDLRHGRDLAHLPGVSRSSPASVSSISAGTVLGSAGQEIEEDYVHLQICNSCAEVGLFSSPPAFSLASDTAQIFSQSSASGISVLIAPHYLTRTTWYVKLRVYQVTISSPYHLLAPQSARTVKSNRSRSTIQCTHSLNYPGRWTSLVHWSQNSPSFQFCSWKFN